MKRILAFILLLALTLSGCKGSSEPSEESSAAFNGDSRVVCLYGSYAEAWLLAGGELVGVTEDAVKERGLDVGEAQVIGTVKEPNAEAIIALEPDLIIFSEDIAAQVDMVDVFTDAGIAVSGYRVDTFGDYSEMMEEFCGITGHEELLSEYVEKPREQIESARDKYGFKEEGPRVLLIRAFSSGIKAKTDDELAGAIMKDLGCNNIADDHPSMLEDLSLEEVISSDPDYIFVTTMGDEDAALSYLQGVIEENPAWEGLAAIKAGRFHVLPKDLFHYKPNHRWGESYEYLGKLLKE
ncbi:ABC transporter substrate-binding protein [Acutalibacter muris]|uniref:ABC transporter substrate-binding protein n=1 Tax=Acutalibacter muris TaxID=1796620 RepID=UPI00272B7D89|nr:ABC transporter substrate-binding protein [Acutalibacter muris]